MTGFTFLHAADLHIDSPLVGLDRYDGAPVDEIRIASRRAFANLVRLAIDEGAAFVVLAGDVFDGEWRDYNTGVFFNQELARLERAGIRVFLVHGNHDAQGQMSRSLRFPANVHVFSHEAAETARLDDLGVAVHGQSFPEQKVTRNLAIGYPGRLAGHFNIGVLHTALEGRDGHASYAPCSLRDLETKGYDYWALGHVHKREEVSRSPWVVFPGNIQGRHIRETGPKGCTVVTVQDGAVQQARHAPLDVVRWASVTVDVGDRDGPIEVIDRIAELVVAEVALAGDRLLALRARARGTGSAKSGALLADPHRWRAELVSRVASVAGHRVWLEKVLFELRATPRPAGETTGNLAVLDGILAELAAVTDGALPSDAQKLQAKLGADGPKDEDSPFAPEEVERARADALALLRFRLRRGERT